MTTEDVINAWLRKNEWAYGLDQWTPSLEETSDFVNKTSEKSREVIDTRVYALTKEFDERIEEKMVYYVKFEGTDKLYAYYCAPHIDLQLGKTYMLEADRITNYKNPATVMRIGAKAPAGINIRTITHARPLGGSKRPDDKIKQVIFNKEKRTTVVLWSDGQKTIVKCQDGDVFDEEKALALCYMKRVLGNRGSFNETLKKWCPSAYEEN